MSEKPDTDQLASRRKWSRYRDYLHKLPHTAFNTVKVDENVCCMACDGFHPTLEQCTKCGLQLCGDCSSLIVQSRCRGSLHTLIGIVARWKRGFSSQFLNREEDEVKAGRGMAWTGARKACRGIDIGRGYGLSEDDTGVDDAGIEGSFIRRARYQYFIDTGDEDEEEDEDEDDDEEEEYTDEDEDGGTDKHEGGDEDEDLEEWNIRFPDQWETKRAFRRRSIITSWEDSCQTTKEVRIF